MIYGYTQSTLGGCSNTDDQMWLLIEKHRTR